MSAARRAGLSLAVASALVLPRLAGATVPSDLCTGNPCNVTGSITVDVGSVLEFGSAIELRLKPSAVLTVGAGGGFRSITLRAGTIIMEAGSRILGNGDGAGVFLDAQSGPIDLQASGSTLSRILVNSLSAGTIDMTATGNVTVSGTLDAHGSGEDGIGGSISIVSGGAVAIEREIEIGGEGPFNSGGDLTVAAQTGIAVNGNLDGGASGDGATLDLFTMTGDVVVTKKIDVSGGSPEGLGGSIDLTANTGNVTITGGPIVGNGGTGIEESCGDGAELNLTAGQAVSLGTTVTLNAGTQCFGGAITIVAGTTFTQEVGANITAQGPGSFGGGGALTVQTGSDVTLRTIDFTSPGVGGFFDIRSSSGTVSFLGAADARGTGTFGIGGLSDVTGCNITVSSPGGKIDVRGNFAIPMTGTNTFTAGGTINITGQLLASSSNLLRVRPGSPPIITGTVTPAATVEQDDDIPTCAVIEACGNGVLEPPDEFCDDDNIANCDGCSADCQRADDVCGDNITECGEQCDDGNTEDGDGCNADCTLPGAEGVRFAGAILATAGCFAEWELKLSDPAINPTTGFPKIDQTCIDGDATCDTDEAKNFSCSFEARICLRVPDPRLPSCTPAPIEYVTIKYPDSLTQGPQVDRDNFQRMLTAVEGLGGQVRVSGDIVQPGPALSEFDNCTAPISLVVPLVNTAKKSFNILAHDTSNKTMNSNQMRLQCLVNTSVCGNGVEEVTEGCDDGNTSSCDGCSSACKVEFCGDGIVACNEQCDDGSANGDPGSRCSETCEQLPPELRIPGGGAKSLDCGFEYSADLNTANLKVDAKGLPKTIQNCTDNDPACDLDPAAGNCRIRVWGCAGAADSRLACTAAAMFGPEVLSPNSRATGTALAARMKLGEALLNLPNPAGPGEVCTTRFDVDVARGPKPLVLKAKMRFFGTNKTDIDTLKLRCVAP